MKTKLAFDFIVNKEANTMTIKKEFAAARQQVWDCFTKSELLDQWFAPEPYKAKTKHMDFSEGGNWLFAMISPEGEEHWSRFDFQRIQRLEHYTAADYFCDENGKPNPDLPQGNWKVNFSNSADTTEVDILISYSSLEDLEVVVQMGMQEGLTQTLEQLEALLEKSVK
ncbi:SRPBCC domain-containing protein [Echinicola strongylocentroti]|uniref:SRPBCC domain-containing protein n=1 Tax=Echinicola strongylocentroti TaxID=1795355 RepID=A0A2Z4INF3_9BACT|nr:SRPBCC domain-containing protein [Echinicola strongylocentroti]AWW32631.1 SRPBCC domain-containing protein [Echinicola strongylocentroti]